VRGLREPISSSWGRCTSAGVDPEQGSAPMICSTEEAAERWRTHPLSVAEPVLRELLADVRSDDDQVVLACDADGSLLWIDGEPAVLDAGHEIHLEPGALWSEEAAGTNAMGTALALDHPIQVFSAEHFTLPVHGWTCSAAPVHDPATGKVLGVIDLSGEMTTAHPHSLALVTAAVRVVEAELARELAREQYRVRSTHLRRSRRRVERISASEASELLTPLEIRALGRSRAQVGGAELSPRHSEIVTLLALEPEGLAPERLARELYGQEGIAVTARAELSRLRRILGTRLPRGGNGLAGAIDADFLRVATLLRSGRVAEAVRAYTGPILPESSVPAIVEARERLDLELRQACLAAEGTALLAAWIDTPSGRDDIEACRTLVRALPEGDPDAPAVVSRLRRLAREADRHT
jgi:hypothetical protein